MENVGEINFELKKRILTKVKDFLLLNNFETDGDNLVQDIKELCVARICRSVGIKCEYNSKNDYFNFFAMITGQAVVDKLNIRLEIAPASLRLVKYDGKNLVGEVLKFLDKEDVDEAFVDAFNLIDDYTYLIDKIKF